MPDTRKGSIIIHQGDHYGGAAQRTVTVFGYSEESILRRLAEKRRRANKNLLPSGKTTALKSLKSSAGKVLLVDVERIQWVPINGEQYFEINSRKILHVIKDKGLSQRFWPYRYLYTDMATRIRRLVKSNRIEPRARFIVTATGTDPKYKREFGTFIKLSIDGSEFILPNSFPRDFREIIFESRP